MPGACKCSINTVVSWDPRRAHHPGHSGCRAKKQDLPAGTTLVKSRWTSPLSPFPKGGCVWLRGRALIWGRGLFPSLATSRLCVPLVHNYPSLNLGTLPWKMCINNPCTTSQHNDNRSKCVELLLYAEAVQSILILTPKLRGESCYCTADGKTETQRRRKELCPRSHSWDSQAGRPALRPHSKLLG